MPNEILVEQIMNKQTMLEKWNGFDACSPSSSRAQKKLLERQGKERKGTKLKLTFPTNVMAVE